MENYKNRNEDFLKRVDELCRNGAPGRGCRTVKRAVKMAINSGAPSFYITRDYAWKKLHERRRSVPPREKPHRRAMWEELEEAYERCRREHPEMDGWRALDMVLTHHNPSGFFLSEEYAWRLVRNLWRRPRKARSKNQTKTKEETNEPKREEIELC